MILNVLWLRFLLHKKAAALSESPTKILLWYRLSELMCNQPKMYCRSLWTSDVNVRHVQSVVSRMLDQSHHCICGSVPRWCDFRSGSGYYHHSSKTWAATILLKPYWLLSVGLTDHSPSHPPWGNVSENVVFVDEPVDQTFNRCPNGLRVHWFQHYVIKQHWSS